MALNRHVRTVDCHYASLVKMYLQLMNTISFSSSFYLKFMLMSSLNAYDSMGNVDKFFTINWAESKDQY